MAVAVHDRVVRPHRLLEAGDPEAVHEDVVVAAEPGERTAHGEVGGMVDVEAIDLLDRGGADAHGEGPAADLRRERLALGGRERLGVADPRDAVGVDPDDHGGGHHGSAGRRDPDLVHAGHAGSAGAPQGAFAAKGRDEGRHRPEG